jgi:hypothetical protein
LAAELGPEDVEPSLYMLLVQASGERRFSEGATIGQIEDYLMSLPPAQ